MNGKIQAESLADHNQGHRPWSKEQVNPSGCKPETTHTNHMGQSLSQLYVHLTFGTQNRYPFIHQDVEERLHSYVAGIFKNLESPALIINSVPDHIHILFRLSKNYALAKVVEEVKKQSSKWLKEVGYDLRQFSWQTGYGAFSVSSSAVNVVRNYILSQKEHHRKKSYQEEVEEFIRKYDVIEYDSAYFWK
jgi:putative transposase